MVVITLGSENNKETIRKAFAMGADSGVLLKDDNHRDSLGVAKALAEEIKAQDSKLVFMGKQSVLLSPRVVLTFGLVHVLFRAPKRSVKPVAVILNDKELVRLLTHLGLILFLITTVVLGLAKLLLLRLARREGTQT